MSEVRPADPSRPAGGQPAAAATQAAPTAAPPPVEPRPVEQPAAETAPLEQHPRRTDWNPIMRGAMLTLLVLVGLLFLALLLSGTGMLRIPGLGAEAVPTREPIFNDTESSVLGTAPGAYPGPPATVPPPGPPPGPPPAVGARFEGFYFGRGGERVLGRPIGEATLVNGREVQWFERARVEHWPEHAGTPYELQLGLLGVEYTAGRSFPGQGYFVSGPDLRYFPETGHAVGGAFLRFYDAYGGLDAFGYPISDEFDEVLPDGRSYRVQYFQRARMELHPELAGSGYEVQLGLLGTALYRNEARPTTLPPAPTPVP